MGELLAKLEREQAALQRSVFESAPQNFADFAKRQGEWIGLQKAIDHIKDILEGEDSDQ